MERDYRPALCAWAGLLGFVVGWDVAAKVTGVPTLSAGASRGVEHGRLRWVLWASGGVLAHHLLVPPDRKLRIRRR